MPDNIVNISLSKIEKDHLVAKANMLGLDINEMIKLCLVSTDQFWEESNQNIKQINLDKILQVSSGRKSEGFGQKFPQSFLQGHRVAYLPHKSDLQNQSIDSQINSSKLKTQKLARQRAKYRKFTKNNSLKNNSLQAIYSDFKTKLNFLIGI